jgi:hypothetical protein
LFFFFFFFKERKRTSKDYKFSHQSISDAAGTQSKSKIAEALNTNLKKKKKKKKEKKKRIERLVFTSWWDTPYVYGSQIDTDQKSRTEDVDYGVWIPKTVLFDPIPIQLSLCQNEDFSINFIMLMYILIIYIIFFSKVGS